MNSVVTRKNANNARLKFFDRIVRDPGITGMAIKVAWRLVDRINNETGLCCPSVGLLTRELGANEKTIRRSVALLIDRGWFSKRRRGYRGTQYFPNYEWRADMPAEEDETNWTNAPEKPDSFNRKIRTALPAEHTNQHTSEPSEDQEGVCKTASASYPSLHADPSAHAVWNAHRSELIEAIGEGDFMVWLDPLTPESDDGRILVLAASTQFSVEQIALNFRDILEGVLDRNVVVVERSWAAEAYERRQAEQAATSKTNKVVDK